MHPPKSMTTSQKSGLGFGTLTLLLVLACVAVLVRVQAIDKAVREQSDVARPRSEAARELGNNVVGYALAVRSFVQTDEPEFRLEADAAAANVERRLADYERLATTERHRQLAARFVALWREYRDYGRELLNSKNRPLKRGDSERLAGLHVGLEQFLEGEMKQEAIQSYDAQKDATFRNVEAITGFVLILLVVGVAAAVLMSGAVVRAVVRGERNLARQAVRLRTTLASIGDGVITTDTEGRVTNLNAVAESLTGWADGEAAGQPLDAVFRIVNETTREAEGNPAARALREGVVVGLANHTVLVAKDGRERAISNTAAPIRCVGGELVGCVLVFRDVSERRRLELENAERGAASRLLSAIVESSDDAVVSKSLDGTIQTWNAAARRLFGYTAEQAVGRPVTMLIPADRTDEEVRIIARVLAGERVEHFDTVRLRSDGRPVHVSLTISPVRDEGGRVVGASKIARDITDRRRAEQELRDARSRLESMLVAAEVGTWEFDVARNSVQADPNLARMFGVSPDEAAGGPIESYTKVIHPDDRDRVKEAIGRSLEAGVGYEAAYRLVGPSGTVRWVVARGRVERDGAGRAVRLSGVVVDITTQRQAEDRRLALDAAEMGAWNIDPATDALTSDERFRTIFHGSTAPLTYEQAFAAIHPDDRQRVRDGVAAATRPDDPVPYAEEYRVVYPDGSVRWVFGKGRTHCEGGRLASLDGTVVDITDRKRADEAVRESGRRLAVEVEAMNRLHELVSRLPRCADLPAAMSEVLDATVAVVGADMGSVQLLDPQSGTLVIAAHRGFTGESLEHFRCVSVGEGTACGRARGARQRVAIEDVQADEGGVPHLHIAASEDWHGVQSTPLVARSGRLLGTLSTHYRRPHRPADRDLRVLDLYARQAADFIERFRAEQTLRVSEQRLRMVVESATDYAIFTMDGTGVVTGWNVGAGRLFGYSDAEIVGRHDGVLYTPDDLARGVPNREIRRAAQDGRAVSERWHLRKDGSRFWGSGLIQPLRGDGGVVVGFLKIMRDMTDARYWQQTLERQAEELREADRKKDVFLATLAHELRNPLAPIRNGLQVIRLAGVSESVERVRSMMDRQLTQLVRLVDDLLDVSRVTSGKLELRRGRVEVKAVIDAAVETSRTAIEQAGHELVVAVPHGPIFVDGDATRLAQVVSNLLNNSAKYTHRGGHVRLSVGQEDGLVAVSVKDDGIGIPPAMLGKVFEMFVQVDRALEKTTGGLGIGLSLVKGLVEMHGGTIEVYSEGEGRGSEFVVRLPVVVPAADVPDSTDGVANGAVPPGGRRVLVVDDNADAADSLGQLLELLGNEVRTANDGVAGIEAAAKFRPHVVVMDIGMPKLNGYEAARRIREQPWGRDMVLVALTGWGQDDDRKKSADAGFDHHLVKPVDAAALTKLLAEVETAMA